MQNNVNKQIDTKTNQHIANLTCDSAIETHPGSVRNELKSPSGQHLELNAVPAHVRTAHIERVACPLHIIELTKNLKKIEVSETLKIIVGGQAVISELLSACHSLGHGTLIIENEGHKELFVTRKR